MKPGSPHIEELLASFPELDKGMVHEHVSRLSPRYFSVFSNAEVRTHLDRLAGLSPEHPLGLIVERAAEGDPQIGSTLFHCTVLAYDYPFEFSLISGILSASGMNILAGDVFTYDEPGSPSRNAEIGEKKTGRMNRPFIIDRFTGTVATILSEAQWEHSVADAIRGVLILLEKGTDQTVTQAKQTVNGLVAEAIGRNAIEAPAAFSPLSIEIDDSGEFHTEIRIVSEDSPFFLYGVSSALALRGTRILRVRITTGEGKIKDEFDVVDASGRKITDRIAIDRIRASVLLTKQFTWFLGESPDPYSALVRFESIVERITDGSGGKLLDAISDTQTMKELAKLLGSSDFLWEDFIRLNYEHLLPMLSEIHLREGFALRSERIKDAIDETVDGPEFSVKDDAAILAEKRNRLNDFKDSQIFSIDLEHILIDRFDFRKLSERLTRLAEAVISKAFEIHYERLRSLHGTPRTVAGQTARYAIFGLGKFGGMALGYASDIEVLFVYSDSGETDGAQPVSNSHFFEMLVRDATLFIDAKREGIFRIDLRLRPYGDSGPLAVSLDQFCRYFEKGGGAHSLERLAMVRLRSVGGDPILGHQVERLRDELIYKPQGINLGELASARNKQIDERADGGRPSAKYSRGALVDLEYAVMILQVKYAAASRKLKTPLMDEALTALSQANVLSPEESSQLVETYNFFRRLINGLRMLRGSALDLSIPPPDSDEFAHLARRMGYESSGTLSSLRKLHMEFETKSATIRVFIDRHFGADSIIGEAVSTITDIIFFREIPEAKAKEIIGSAGFSNVGRAYTNIRRLADRDNAQELFARLSVLAFDIMKQMPDRDMALNNWERFVTVLDSATVHYESLLAQPTRLEILLRIFSASQFLSDTLVRYPEFLDSVLVPETINKNKPREQYSSEIAAFLAGKKVHAEWLDGLRRYRIRETLRTATRDICLGIQLPDIMDEISRLAEAIISHALDAAWKDAGVKDDGNFCICAFGKLGGVELNYSSDIDIIGIYDEERTKLEEQTYARLMERIVSSLSSHTNEGIVYRIDLRLRPFGRAGTIVSSYGRILEYYSKHADLREVQALIKLRHVAGGADLGDRFITAARTRVLLPHDRVQVIDTVEKAMKDMDTKNILTPPGGINIKTGSGGIRSIEFLIQALQLIHGHDHPGVVCGNSLRSLALLADSGCIRQEDARSLAGHYIYFRRLEHFLQIHEDRKTHTLPADTAELSALVRRIEGPEMTNDRFRTLLAERLHDVEKMHRACLSG